jgi:hypothetical protein
MTTPSTNDYPQYTNKPLNDADWLNMTQATVSAETDGTKDFTINSLTTTNGVTAGTSVSAASITTTGVVTAGSFVGDGSGLTNTSIQQKNFLINGDGRLNTLANYTLVNNVYSNKAINGVNYWEAMASGTAVTNGTYNTNSTAAVVGRTGYSHVIENVTATGSGIVYLRYRMQSKDAVNFIGQKASFSSLVYHDVGSAINYTVTIRKANSADNFSATTVISTGTAQSVPDTTATAVKLENVSMATCGNGIEIEIKAECGAVTTKKFYFTEMQFELSTSATNYEYMLYEAIQPLAMKSMKLIYENTLVANATSLVVSGLDLNTDLHYKVLGTIINNSTAAGSITLKFETANTHYYRRVEYFGTTGGWSNDVADGQASIYIGATGGTNTVNLIDIDIASNATQTGRAFVTSRAIAQGASATVSQWDLNCGFFTSASNQTSFTLTGSVANTLGTGSIISVYARR